MYAVQIALALAVSMLIFATFASMVIEIFYKLKSSSEHSQSCGG